MVVRSPDLLLPLLVSPTPVTLAQPQQALGQPSRRTTFRYLRPVPYLPSYNHNGRFYTARAPDRFARWPPPCSVCPAHPPRTGRRVQLGPRQLEFQIPNGILTR